MNSEVAWVLVSLGIQVRPQIILDLYYLQDYLSISYDYVFRETLSCINTLPKLLIVTLVIRKLKEG